MSEEFNGWVNRESWACGLHLSNTEFVYNDALEVVAAKLVECRRFSDEHGVDVRFGAWGGRGLEEWVLGLVDRYWAGEWVPDEIPLMIQDVGSWWRVDWEAVAASFVEEVLADA